MKKPLHDHSWDEYYGYLHHQINKATQEKLEKDTQDQMENLYLQTLDQQNVINNLTKLCHEIYDKYETTSRSEENVKDKLSYANTHIEDLSANIKDLNANIKYLNSKLELATEDIDNLRDKIHDDYQKISLSNHMVKKLVEQNTKIDSLNSDIRTLKSKHSCQYWTVINESNCGTPNDKLKDNDIILLHTKPCGKCTSCQLKRKP